MLASPGFGHVFLVMFVDVRGFTALSEEFQPTRFVSRLNRFYKLTAQSVFNLDGTLDKMVGYQAMAFFECPSVSKLMPNGRFRRP